MQVNFTGEKDYMSAGPGYAQKSGAGKKIAAGVVVAAGLAAVGFAAHKGDVFKKIANVAKNEEGKFDIGKLFKSINMENVKKAFKGIGNGFVAIKDSIVTTAKKVMPKAKEAAEEVADDAQKAAETVAQ